MFEQDYGERIPLTLTGVGRFFLELETKHHSKVPADINTKSPGRWGRFDISIQHSAHEDVLAGKLRDLASKLEHGSA